MFKKILAYSNSDDRHLKIAIVQSMLSVAFSIIPYVMTFLVIDRLISGQPLTRLFLVTIASTVIVTLMLQHLFFLRGLSHSHLFAYNVLQTIRQKLQERLEALPIGYVKDKGKGALKQLFVEDIDSIETPLAHAIPEGISNLMVTVTVIVLMLLVDWQLALLALGSLPVALIAFLFMFKIGANYMPAYYAAGQKMNNTIVEYINGMEVVKVFNQDGRYFGTYQGSILNYRDKTIAQYKATRPAVSVYQVMFAAAGLVLLPVGSYLVLTQGTPLAKLVLVFCLATSLGGPLLRLVSFLPALMQVTYKITELENAMTLAPLKVGDSDFTGANYDVVFERVDFAYGETAVLQQVSFRAQEGQTTAVVGPSGSGKSTLAQLLVHYYDPDAGKITIGGQDIQELSLATLGELVSYVSQDVFLFNQSILDNIRLGKPHASDQEVMAAAEQAQCLSIFEHLPEGIETVVGAKGDKLSGGEKQRLAIARAFLKNAPILLLDEAMAYIDAENEKSIQQGLAALAKNKTVITIGHRLQSLTAVEKTYVLNDGKVESVGTHQEILEASPTYRRLWQAALKSDAWQPKGGL